MKKPAYAGFFFRYPDGQATPDVGLVVRHSVNEAGGVLQRENLPVQDALTQSTTNTERSTTCPICRTRLTMALCLAKRLSMHRSSLV